MRWLLFRLLRYVHSIYPIGENMSSKVYHDFFIYTKNRQNKSALRKVNLSAAPGFRDVFYGGNLRISGTTAVAGSPDVPVARLVILMDERSKRVVRSKWSTEAGGYIFNNVASGPWTVIAWDHTGEYNAVISANITGELM